MRRILVVVAVLMLMGALLTACKGNPTPFQLPTPTPTPAPPPTIPPPALASSGYMLAQQTPDELLAFLEQAVNELAAPEATSHADLAEQVEITAREVRSQAAGDATRRAQAAWYAALAYHRVGASGESLAWLRPALLDRLNAGEVALQPPPYSFDLEDVRVEVAAIQDLDGDGADEWLLWLRFNSPPNESVSFVVKEQAGVGYVILPAEGGWPQVGDGGTVLVEMASDINADGRPEIAISAVTCGDPGCAGKLTVYTWRDGQFASLTQPREGIPLRNVRWAISDPDRDGQIEISLVAERTGVFGWGCRWKEITIYEWDAAAEAYTFGFTLEQYPDGDAACLMTQADRALETGDYGAAVSHLNALLALPAETLVGLGADFAAFARFRLGVAYALSGQPEAALAEMENARRGAFMKGLVSAFLDHYRGGATPHAACAVAAYYAVSAPPPYELIPVNAYGGLTPAMVCPGGHDAVQSLIRTGAWRTDAGLLRTQLNNAGIPLLSYIELNLDADADSEALALTQTDFPFVWLFDADASGAIKPTRVATAKQALSMNAFTHDIDGDGAPEAYLLVEMRDPLGSRCVAAPTATVLRVEKFTGGTAQNLLTTVDCRPPAELEVALRANPAIIAVVNNLGVDAPIIHTYTWSPDGYAAAQPTPSAGLPPVYAQPTDAERQQLEEAKDAMLEHSDLGRAWGLLEPLLALPPEQTEPDFHFEVRYLAALWHERTGEVEAARLMYYQLWADAPGSGWGELARRKLKP